MPFLFNPMMSECFNPIFMSPASQYYKQKRHENEGQEEERIEEPLSSLGLSRMIVLRPLLCFILLVVLVLLIPSFVIPYWYHIIKGVEKNVELDSSLGRAQIMSGIQDTARLLHPMNSSATNLARILNSTAHGKHVTFPFIQAKVAPILFQALTTIPHLSQISYIGFDGLFFSYYMDNNQTLAIYSNTSFTANYTWYTQSVNPDDGILNGNPTIIKPTPLIDNSWLKTATIVPNSHTSLGSMWYNDNERLLLKTASVSSLRGLISLGFGVDKVTSLLSTRVRNHRYGFKQHIVTSSDGVVLLDGLPGTKVNVGGLGNGHDKIVSIDQLVDVIEEEKVLRHVANVSCGPDGSVTNEYAIFKVGGKSFEFYCSTLDIIGLNTVYIIAFPHQGLPNRLHKDSEKALYLLTIMLLGMILSTSTFVYLVMRASRREMHLYSALIKQIEATQHAERKSLKKSFAVAGASHDVRASLAGIKGLLQLCFNDVPRGSELETNLRQMEKCSNDLLIMLNNILDISKIDSGKMELQEEEFSLSQTLEDVADLFHPVGMMKDVDVILDPCDGSVFKIPKIKGDRSKLNQILWNLLSNAVKFTSDGHVMIRAWVRKPRSDRNQIIVYADHEKIHNRIWDFFSKRKNTTVRIVDDHKVITKVKQNPNCMEFFFEVDDTGKGIPKENREAIFEDFIQLKDTSGEGIRGTGLGLGIVQSLVRLMGGDIAVVDKKEGKGSCFRFNVFFIVPSASSLENYKEGDFKSGDDLRSLSLLPRSYSPSIKSYGSLVVLLIQNDGRRMVVQKYMERLDIRVVVLMKADHLFDLLNKIKHNPNTVHSQTICPCILFVIDASAGDFGDLARSVAEFKKDVNNNNNTICKVVWLEKPINKILQSQRLEHESLDVMDTIMTKPLHGSRLYKVIELLLEFEGEKPVVISPMKMTRTPNTTQVKCENYPILSHNQVGIVDTPRVQCESGPQQYREIVETQSSCNQQLSLLRIRKDKALPKEAKKHSGVDIREPLVGKNILLVEDNPLLSKLAMVSLKKMGACVEAIENGEKALAVVRQGLEYQACFNSGPTLPYDCILMDCEMPIMNGFEATRQIRKEEGKYGIYIPIIALTSHGGEEGKRINEAGMDYHLIKPLKEEELLEAMRCIHKKQSKEPSYVII